MFKRAKGHRMVDSHRIDIKKKISFFTKFIINDFYGVKNEMYFFSYKLLFKRN